MSKSDKQTETTDDVAELKQRIVSLEANLQTVLQQLKQAQYKNSALSQQRNNAEDQIAELAAQIATLTENAS